MIVMLEIHASGLRGISLQENHKTECTIYRKEETSGFLQQSFLHAADIAGESKPKIMEEGIDKISERTRLHRDYPKSTASTDHHQSLDTSEPNNSQSPATRNMEAADKTRTELSKSSHGKSLCFSDDDDFEEVIVCDGCHSEEVKMVSESSQELNDSPCACPEASDNFEQPRLTRYLSKEEVHVRLKERTEAWETPSERTDKLQRCSEMCKGSKSDLSGDDCSTIKLADGTVTEPPTTSPNVQSTCTTITSHETPTQSVDVSDNSDNELTASKTNKSIVCETESSSPESTSFKLFDELPRELFFKILSYFSAWELCLTVSPVCKDWYEYSKSPVLLQNLDLSENRDISHNQLCFMLDRVSLLKSLSLRGRDQLCVSEVQMLKGCPLLTSLNLGFCDNVNGRILDEIVRYCPHLEVINMEGCERIDDDVASLFPLLSCLKVLNLSHCTKMTDDGIVLISQGCLLLEKLNVDGIPWITDRAVKLLASERSQTLRAIYLDGAELTDASIGYLTSCPFLHTLSLSFCEQLTDKTLSMLQTLDHLRHLRLKRGLEFSEEALCHFFECGSVGHLTFLDLSECSELMDKGVKSIAHRCPELRKLALCWCWNVSDVGIEEIVQHCSWLRYLDIVGLDKVKGQCLATIPEALPRLTLLDLRQCNLIDDKMLVDLVKVMPHVYIFNYYGEQVTPDMIL